MRSTLRRRLCTGLMVLCLSAPAGQAGEPDFHALFENRCLSCHGHAGPFVRETLVMRDGVLTGRSGRPVETVLRRHAGGLDEAERALFIEVFEKQLAAGGLYEARCRFCHDRARDFARLELIEREGVLLGRYSGRDIAGFLNTHARLTPAEAAALTEALRGVLAGTR